MALLHAKRYKQSYPFFKWLLTQRNDRGGFLGTQDTVVGLQALAMFHESLGRTTNKMNVQLNSDGKVHSFDVNHENALELQRIEVSLKF